MATFSHCLLKYLFKRSVSLTCLLCYRYNNHQIMYVDAPGPRRKRAKKKPCTIFGGRLRSVVLSLSLSLSLKRRMQSIRNQSKSTLYEQVERGACDVVILFIHSLNPLVWKNGNTAIHCTTIDLRDRKRSWQYTYNQRNKRVFIGIKFMLCTVQTSCVSIN
jgi:hypothetical protein